MIKYIAALGGHSALEICDGAHKTGFKTLLVVARGRANTYTEHFRNLVDEYIKVDNFSELTEAPVVKKLKDTGSIFVPHRYCQVYCDMKKFESGFPIPVFGNRYLLKYEEREGNFTQYQLLFNSGLEHPKQFTDPKTIDRLVIVKVKEMQRTYERAFFFARNYSEYKNKSSNLLKDRKISQESLSQAIIEEYLVGAQVNFNFFYSPVQKRIELLSTDMRRQTNIDGLIRLPMTEQKEIADDVIPSYIETGHVAVTVKESLLEKAFFMAERVIEGAKLTAPPGIIGPFALQTAVIAGPPSEKIVVYDISLRIPGSPGTSFTPYSGYLFGRNLNFGERIAMEIKEADKKGLLSRITT